MLPTEILILIGSFIENIDTRRMLGFTGTNKLHESIKENFKKNFQPKRVICYAPKKYSLLIYGWEHDVMYIIRKVDSIFEIINLRKYNNIERWRLNHSTNVWLEIN